MGNALRERRAGKRPGWSVLVLAVLTAVAATAGHEALGRATEPLARRVRLLCERLGSDTLRERVEAERQLIQLGPEVLPLLPPEERIRSPAARWALQRVRYQLQREAAEESVRASRVTVSGRLTLRDLLRKIERQTENPIDASGLPLETLGRLMTVHFENEPFWSVMQKVAQPAGLTWHLAEAAALADDVPQRKRNASPLTRTTSDVSERAAVSPAGVQSREVRKGHRLVLSVAAADRKNERSVCAGAFRVAATVQAVRRSEDRSLVAIQWRVEPEPRVRALVLMFATRDFQARSADGIRMPPFSPDARSELPLGDGRRRLLFVAPEKADLSSITLQGRFTVQIAAGRRPFVFGPLERCAGQTKRSGGASVTVSEVQLRRVSGAVHGKLRGEAIVRIALVYDRGGPAFESYRTWMFHNQVWLELPDGSRVQPWGGFDTTLQTDGAVGIAYRFRGDADQLAQARFVYEAPTFLLDVPVTFRIEGLSLPTPHRTGAAGDARDEPMSF